ncbi:MAG: hypothetical protein V1783_10670, partial [Bacteroidota bacterium]
MKKLLILAYDFPPYTSMGAQRPYGWYLSLKSYSWEPTIITRHWPAEYHAKEDYNKNCRQKITCEKSHLGTIIRVPYKANLRDKIIVTHGFNRLSLIRKLLTTIYSVLQHLSFIFDNKSGIYFEAKKILAQQKFDYIIASGEPFILFRYAYKLAEKFHTPWIADYRDCWSDNFEVNRQGGLNRLLHKSYFRFFERRYVNNAIIITTAAPYFKNQLNLLFPEKKIYVVFNGYNEDEYEINISNISNQNLIIAFGGTIYPFQPLELFFEGLKKWLVKPINPNLKIFFYGADYSIEQKNRILNFDDKLRQYIITTPRLIKSELFKYFSNADIFLLFDNKGMISGKLYEYLPFNKKIILCGRDFGSMEEILTDTNTGIFCNSADDVAAAL